MSVYSAKASSSSSSSSSSSASSSGSTGCFSETSFSSLSTIIAPQAGVKPFGDPDYNYFWIQNQSKTNPKASYYYNYKSHSVVWSRPLPKTVPLPLYSTAWVPEPKNVSEGEEEVIVSDPEDAFQKQRRLHIKQRNRRLAVEDRYGTIDLLSVNNTVKSKKKLDVFWKLYRLPGETVEDVKNRLLEPTKNKVQIKTEVLSNEDENSNSQDIAIISIKKEPEFYNETYDDYSFEVQEASQNIKELEDHSDSDPDNVDFFIQQDYNAANSYDSELEDESYNENDSDNNSQDEEQISDNEEEESSWDSNDDSEEELEKQRPVVRNVYYKESLRGSQSDTRLVTNIEHCSSEESEAVDDFEEDFLLSDMLEIEIDENEKENMFVEFNTTADNDERENVNWNFEKSSEPVENSLLTREALNPVYKVSRPKPIADRKRNKKLTKKMPVETRRVPKIIIKKEPYYHIKQEPDTVTSEPLVYDMYGTRTTNYDHYFQSNEVRQQSCTVLSDSSSEESVVETIAQRIKIEPRRASQNNEKEMDGEQGVLELKNWFPKTTGDSRKRKNSDNEWFGSDLSANSDLDESDVEVLKRHQEKRRRSRIDEQEEFQPESTTPSRSKQQEQALTSAMDLSTVKVELYSTQKDLIGFTQEEGFAMKTQEEEEEEKDVVQNEKPKEEENDATTDSESDSSSCCSRSSCSCSSSSSSSSSSDDENDKQAKK